MLNRQLILNSPVLSVNSGVIAQLAAPYVALGYGGQQATDVAATSGSGTLGVSAQQVTLYGATTLEGVKQVTLTSQGDVQLEPVVQGGTSVVGSFTLAGNLAINAARVYPSTDTSYTITSFGAGNTVSIGQTAASSGTPLSVGGLLTISADNIVNAGTIDAPFGTVALNAGTSLTLAPSSVISVSADGATLPFGQTSLSGAQYIYNAIGIPGASTTALTGVPQPQIALTAPNLTFAKGATVDLKGGGDLQAYEFQPGTGGQLDSLAPGN